MRRHNHDTRLRGRHRYGERPRFIRDAEHGEHHGDLHGHRGGGRHGHRGGGRHGRFFEHGDLRLVVLALIAEQPRHGYDIIKAIEERVRGAYSPSPGVVYPTLTLLEEIGHVSAAAEGVKKLYSITPEGTLFLEANRTAVAALFARIEEAGRARASVDAPQLVRGMENLKLALRLRLGRGPLSEAEVTAIATALDAAATAIERS
jgi:DNA-binding PadR family transcriptional regulator